MAYDRYPAPQERSNRPQERSNRPQYVHDEPHYYGEQPASRVEGDDHADVTPLLGDHLDPGEVAVVPAEEAGDHGAAGSEVVAVERGPGRDDGDPSGAARVVPVVRVGAW